MVRFATRSGNPPFLALKLHLPRSIRSHMLERILGITIRGDAELQAQGRHYLIFLLFTP